ncbi:hypothetical protein B0F90DRAFT_1673495 [Multifurca ochricompacta]|uniref:Chromatin structure-remodeling complex subunit rsc1 n=1 Tax=Multifurca ochricompacta TaxID=376703 RepID=A0AAD4MBP0_9AGAM|nr:hypothetical protein B0F90DRAFT_1673495 [Multifurca ochricompacta]
MTITPAQRSAIEEIIDIIKNTKSPKKKRNLTDLFLELVDKDTWANYYQVIPEPRCLNGVSRSLQDGSYNEPLEAYEDLSLVFLNALYYNEPASQIHKDAETLKSTFENEWKLRTVLPMPTRTSPPPTSAQKVHGQVANHQPPPETPITSAPPAALVAPAKSASQQAPTPIGTSSTSAVDSPAPQQLSTSNQQPSSPPRMSSPDMDVDVGGTPEPEGIGVDDMARDGESDLVVQQLERGLPRWENLGDFGWMKEKDGSEDRWLELVLAIKGHKDAVGNRYATALEAMPEETNIPYLSFNFPLSLKLVESHARAKSYGSNKAFDKEIAQLFEKARRWHEPGSDAYGHVLLLQRLYQALTSPSPPSGPPYISPTNFASLRAGPGTARPLHSSSDSEKLPAVTTFRVSSKDRTFVDEVTYRGWSIKLAEWLHLSNPDDPSKPIIAQVFKCYVSDEPTRKGQPGVTACWYYRPEQTFHPAQRQFWENEVFKTSHFADHPVEDIIEKIACQFTARHIRGRPRPPSWYLGWPLYVCDSRYNDRERIFVKIKNWNSCVPEEVRKSADFMPIYPFERMVFPRRFGSPFLKGSRIRGPGGIGESADKAEGERIEGGGTGRKRSRKPVAPTDISGPSKGLYVGVGPANVPGTTPQPAAYPPQPAGAQPRTEDKSIITAAGGATVLGSNASMEKLPAETARHFDRDPETNEVLWFAAPPLNIARTPAPKYSLQYLHWLATKRKEVDDDSMDVSEERLKRARVSVTPTATETVERLLVVDDLL